MATFLACIASAQLLIWNQCRVRMRRLLHYSLRSNRPYYFLSFSLFLSRGASKEKIVSHWLCYKFFLSIFLFRNIFCQIFFSNFGCNKGTCARKRWKVLSRRVTSQQKSKLKILEIKKYIMVHLGSKITLSENCLRGASPVNEVFRSLISSMD